MNATGWCGMSAEQAYIKGMEAAAKHLLELLPNDNRTDGAAFCALQIQLLANRKKAEIGMDDTLMKLVEKQAQDQGLWFQARTAPEAYLQQELRKLHAAIEMQG